MIRLARAVMFAALPAELLVVVLLVSGAPLPAPLVVAAEAAVTAAILLEAAVAVRLYRAARRGGATRRAAVRAAGDELIPAKVRRIVGFDAKGVASIVLWLLRRRDGVPPGATALPYSGEQRVLMTIMVGVLAVETVAMELLLAALGASAGLRGVVLALDLYSILLTLAIAAACATRPHVVTADELRVRSGAFFDLRIPRSLITSVRLARNYNEPGMVTVRDGRLGLAVSAQTNVVVELSEPVTAVRPLGATAPVRLVRFFTDTPAEAVAALTAEKRAADPIK